MDNTRCSQIHLFLQVLSSLHVMLYNQTFNKPGTKFFLIRALIYNDLRKLRPLSYPKNPWSTLFYECIRKYPYTFWHCQCHHYVMMLKRHFSHYYFGGTQYLGKTKSDQETCKWTFICKSSQGQINDNSVVLSVCV